MSDLTKRFQEIMNDIEKNIPDEKEREYINKKIAEISMLHMEVVDDLTNILKNKIEEIEKNQKSIESKINKIDASVSGIENDIYDEGFDFEIICPYCNTEFTADVESKSDIKCPACQNIIELDWNADEFSGSSGHCSGCTSKCGSTFFEGFGSDFDDEGDDEDEDEDEDM